MIAKSADFAMKTADFTDFEKPMDFMDFEKLRILKTTDFQKLQISKNCEIHKTADFYGERKTKFAQEGNPKFQRSFLTQISGQVQESCDPFISVMNFVSKKHIRDMAPRHG